MSDLPTGPTERRGFLQRLAAATVALTATGWGALHAQGSTNRAASRPGTLPKDDAWLARIRGKHRQVIDAVTANDGFAAAYAANIVDGYKATHKVANADITPVIVFRHYAMPLVLKDELWAKYKIGEFLKINDPKTGAPATRNPFHENVPLHAGMTYASMAQGPYVIVACNLALTVLSSLMAKNAGVTAEEAKQEWTAGVIPGVALAPSGVYAVSRAQENGCQYCYGG
jgi:hypothetical protein